jgi:DNA-directed RNA polymerase I, II, and III subunit RPABC2
MESEYLAGNDEIDDLDVEELDIDDIDINVNLDEEKNTIFSNPIETLLKFHPECVLEYEEVEQGDIPLSSVPPENDTKHRSLPFLSIFEKTKILGMRTNQLAQGARPFITVPEYITDVNEIARLELEQRRLPIIIKRHMPDGSYEKFRLSDMMLI